MVGHDKTVTIIYSKDYCYYVKNFEDPAFCLDCVIKDENAAKVAKDKIVKTKRSLFHQVVAIVADHIVSQPFMENYVSEESEQFNIVEQETCSKEFKN